MLETRGVSKSFGEHPVLRDVSFALRPGEVHVLAGENGAGKSTLIKILSGAISEYAGEVVLDGRPLRFRSPNDAREAGVSTIYQELSLVPSMSVLDNLFLGRETRGQGAIAKKTLDDMGLALDLAAAVETLPLAVAQLVEIAKALLCGARVVIMDEPTSALGEREVETLFARVAALRADGKAILFISHKMEEIYRIADRITVLRDGVVAGTALASELPRDRLIAWMLGRALEEQPMVERDEVGNQSALRVRVCETSFELRRGEIVGLSGLQGSGCSEVLTDLFADPRASLAKGIVFLPNDRKEKGIVPELDVIENATLGSMRSLWIRHAEERALVERTTKELRLSASSLLAPVRTLSGGNQQKVLLARCLLAKPSVLLLDEPTRGVDIGAKTDIHRLLRELASKGVAILMVSSEMEELLAVCHRIVVMHRGRVGSILARTEATRERILRAAMGSQDEPTATVGP
jgi:ABC-type sugar transport system ATPase subunit